MRPFGSLLLAMALAGSAQAELQYPSQTRTLEVESESIGDLWQLGSEPFFPDFDPPTFTYTNPAADGDAATLATVSQLLGTTYVFGIARDEQGGSSHFETTFTNDEPASYQLSASAALSPGQVIGGIVWGDTLGEVTIELREQGGAVPALGLAGPALLALALCLVPLGLRMRST